MDFLQQQGIQVKVIPGIYVNSYVKSVTETQLVKFVMVM